MPSRSRAIINKLLAIAVVLASQRGLLAASGGDVFKKDRAYSKQEIVSTLTSNAETESGEPIGEMELAYAASLVPWDQEELFVVVHRSYKHHLDRLNVWKRTLDGYRLLQSFGSSPDSVGSSSDFAPDLPYPSQIDMSYLEFPPPRLIHLDGETCLYVHMIGYRAADDLLFQIEPDLALRQIKIENPRERYQNDKQLGPGEDIRMSPNSSFSDKNLSFDFEIWKRGDSMVEPAAGKVTGTYKSVKSYDPERKRWTIQVVVDSYKRTLPAK